MALLCSPVVNSTIVNEVSDEKFEEVHSPINITALLLNDGRTFETIKRTNYQCALGKKSYSTGIHQIRFKVHYGSAFIGIRSRRIQLEPSRASFYHDTPSTYGWFTIGSRIVNGYHINPAIDVTKREDTMIELIVNCDEHRLAIVIGEENGQRDELKVDDLQAPFPWCLFVQLSWAGARISLV